MIGVVVILIAALAFSLVKLRSMSKIGVVSVSQPEPRAEPDSEPEKKLDSNKTEDKFEANTNE